MGRRAGELAAPVGAGGAPLAAWLPGYWLCCKAQQRLLPPMACACTARRQARFRSRANHPLASLPSQICTAASGAAPVCGCPRVDAAQPAGRRPALALQVPSGCRAERGGGGMTSYACCMVLHLSRLASSFGNFLLPFVGAVPGLPLQYLLLVGRNFCIDKPRLSSCKRKGGSSMQTGTLHSGDNGGVQLI